MKALKLSSGAKTAIFILGVVFLGIVASFQEEPDSNKRNETDLERLRRREVFYRTFPVIQLFWSINVGANSQFTVTDIRSSQSTIGFTSGNGLLWRDGHTWNDHSAGLVGQMSYRFFHSKGKIEPDSFWIEILMPSIRVQEIQDDPYERNYNPQPLFRKQRMAAPKPEVYVPPIATLGEDAQRKLRQLSKGGWDTFMLAGMEWTLALDKKQNLRILLRGSLTSGMFPVSSLRSFARSTNFRTTVGDDLWKVLRERAFVDEAHVSSFLPNIDSSEDHPYMRLVAVLPSGNAYIVGMLGQSSSNGNELHFRIGNEQTRKGNGSTNDFRDEFRAYLQRIQWPNEPTGKPVEVDTDGQYYVRADDMKVLAEMGTYPTAKTQKCSTFSPLELQTGRALIGSTRNCRNNQ